MSDDRIPFLDDLERQLDATWETGSPLGSRRSPAVIALATFAVVLVLVGSPWLLRSEPSLAPATPTAGTSGTDGLVGIWSLVDATVDGSGVYFANPLELALDGKMAYGFAGCSGFGSAYETGDDGAWRLDDGFGVQAVSCGTPVDEMQVRYLDGLMRATTFRVGDGRLVLSGSQVELVYEHTGMTPPPTNPPPPTTAAPDRVAETRGTWRLTEWMVDGGPIDRSVDITLSLSGERTGQVHGSGGCNEYSSGSYLAEGTSWTLSVEPTHTAIGCAKEIMDSEARYHEALRQIETFDVAPDRLELRGPGVRLVFERLDDDPASPTEDGGGTPPESD